ncbi:MAG: PhoH family protein [Deltaproteobacteria bacterium]|nr:PhoH family protein [Deltaproteobacteria bacterium]
MLKVLGPRCENLAVLQRELDVTLGQRGLSIHIKGKTKHVMAGLKLVDQLVRASHGGRSFSEIDLVRGSRILHSNPNADLDDIFNEVVYVTAQKRLVTPKGLNQKQYVDAMRASDLTFSIGPAGTGKTYLAVAVAVSELMQKRCRRIVLARPAVEAGERLGFLPGDLIEKVNPYLRPLYDALDDILGSEKTQTFIAQDQIEIAPLAFMRGRTLNDSFVILDEAQNTTPDQMKMFLTRLGYSSKAVVTGDVSQVDLPNGAVSGLIDARQVLANIDGISFIHFTEIDVVRHPLVQDIIKAYDNRQTGRQGREKKERDDRSS